MEVYILDSLLRRERVIDTFESLIWTERWSEIGDFEMKISSTVLSRQLFKTGVQLAMNESYRVMTVESVEDTTDEDGQSILTVKGRSLEAFLEDRIGKTDMQPMTDEASAVGIYGRPKDIAQNLFYSTCVQGALDPKDILPFYQFGTLFPEETIPEPDTVYVELEVDSLYEMIKGVCDTFQMGFRIVRYFDNSQLYFNVYTGNDRTTSQQVLTPLVFAPDLDNLQNTTELTSIDGEKNVAYAFSDTASAVVYADGVPTNIAGFQRKVLLVKVSDPTETDGVAPTPTQVHDYLVARAKEELAKHRATSIFDGEMNQNSTRKYGIDYQLGDLVELRNVDGEISIRRIIEQIFVSDTEGDRSYPTLSQNT